MTETRSCLAETSFTPQRRMMTVDGIEIPALFSSLQQEVKALRSSVALSDLAHAVCLRLIGDDAYDLLDQICPLDLYLRDGQLRHTLLLSPAGAPISDLYIGNDDEAFLLLSEGLPAATFIELLQAQIKPDQDVAIEDLSHTHTLLSLNGPFAWELMAKWLGPSVIGFPYLTFYRPSPDRIFFRAGKTGEYGYHLLLPKAEASATWEELSALGEDFDLAWAGMEALAHCGMENFFFDIAQEGEVAKARGLTPIELQLQWRISYRKTYPGAEAVTLRRKEGPQHLLMGIVSPQPLQAGAPIHWQEREIGRVIRAAPPVYLRHWGGLALLEQPWAYSGIQHYTVAGQQPITTVSTPLVNNLSLHIKTQKHSYRERHLLPLPLQRW